MADTFTVEGMEEIRRKLESLKDTGGRRILKAALRAAINEIAREMRSELPGKVKEGRKAIRGLVKGTRRVTAKVGVHVRCTDTNAAPGWRVVLLLPCSALANVYTNPGNV